MSEKLTFNKHPRDEGIDEILFTSERGTDIDAVRAGAFLRLGLRERYKTSGMSGDEWRFSTVLQLRKPNTQWRDVSTGYHKLSTHAAFLYAELYGDFVNAPEKHAWLYREKVAQIAFLWKRLPVWAASYDGAATDLLVACGHLPGALISAPEQGLHHHKALARLCSQPGCANELVSIYRKREDFCRFCGKAQVHYDSIGPYIRGFCRAHLRRGDCGLDDADANYEVIHGPGPDGNEPDPSRVSESRTVIL